MRILGTLFVFLLIGPPVGLVSSLLGFLMPRALWAYTEVNFLHTLDCDKFWRSECQFLTAAHPMPLQTHWMEFLAAAYVFGAAPALFSGALVAAGMSNLKRFGVIHVVGIGCVVGVVLALITFIGPNNRTFESFLLVSTTLGLLPTIVCWLPIWLWSREPAVVSNPAVDDFGSEVR
jgi:hypothetical protein